MIAAPFVREDMAAMDKHFDDVIIGGGSRRAACSPTGSRPTDAAARVL